VPVPSDKMVLTVPEAAELLSISPATCYNWTHIEGFPLVKIGNTSRIHRDQLLEWFKAQAGRRPG
jgi:excisionase family DNA binding protein